MARRVMIERDGVAIGELLDGEHDQLQTADDGAFEVDPDDRPTHHEATVWRAAVLSTEDDQLLGSVSWHATGYGRSVTNGAWNIGIGLLPEARGRGVGSLAQRLLAEHLFATTEVDRIEASTDVDNVAEQRALTRAGFRAEGVLRGAQLRGGVRRDMVGFGLLRSDIPSATAEEGPRRVLVERDGVTLAVPRDGERERVGTAAADDPFALDFDPRPRPVLPPRVFRATILSTEDERLLGSISWHAVGHGGTLGCTAWNIGILLLPGERGRGVGSRAQRLLAEYLFATTEVDRVEAGTDVANVAEQRALVRAGFRAEGVLRGAQLRGGMRRDMAVFGLLRTDVEQARTERTVVIERNGVALALPLPDDLQRVFTATSSEFDVDSDPRPRPALPGRSSWLLVTDAETGTVLGGLSWRPVDHGGTLGSMAWSLGVGLVPEARGRGIGALAQRLLAEYLFATTEVDRVEAETDVDNVAERRALERAGFHEEGVLRRAQVRGGERHDLVLYALLRD